MLQNSGVIVDHFGERLLAFWNAPPEIHDHASMAVKCAMNIQDDLAAAGQEWEAMLERPLQAGIGIATGPAHVGNRGSPQRIKYGHHEGSVNLAVRLEQLAKRLAMPIVISELTAEHMSIDFLSRRICKVRVKGFCQALNIYEPLAENSEMDNPGFQELLKQFSNEVAL